MYRLYAETIPITEVKHRDFADEVEAMSWLDTKIEAAVQRGDRVEDYSKRDKKFINVHLSRTKPEYRAVNYHNVEAEVSTPQKIDWSEMSEGESVECSTCRGTGKYYGAGYTENGEFKGKVGVCFRCEGKGRQTRCDENRNAVYDANRSISIY